MVLRKCKLEDINLLMDITQTTYREHYQYLWKDKGEGYIQTNYSETALRDEIANPNLLLYFVTQAAVVYGFLKLGLVAPLNNYTAEEGLELARIYF